MSEPSSHSAARRLRVLVLTRYGSQGGSSRIRFLQYAPFLKASGFDLTFVPFFSNELLLRRYETGGYTASALAHSYVRRMFAIRTTKQFDLVWIEQEILPWLPFAVERMLLPSVPYVLDYDDALFHTYDLHPRKAVRKLLGAKVARLMQRATLVVTGNDYLADYARRAGAPHVAVLPSVVDFARYGPLAPVPEGIFTIGWVGSPGSERLLESLRPLLAPLVEGLQPAARLVLVGATQNALAGLPREIVPWHLDTEAAEIDRFHVGIMPLQDTPFERGKCGFKLIQYMARARPVVASPVGVNAEIVGDGEAGLLASDADAWRRAFDVLRGDHDAIHRFGTQGYRRAQARYALAVTAPQLAEMLRRAADSRPVSP